MAEFTPIETQEAFDEAIKARLARQNEKHSAEIAALKENYADYETAKEKSAKYDELIANKEIEANAYNEKITGYESKIAEQEGKIKALELGALKSKVAYEYGIPQEATKYLLGATEEELRASAEELNSFAPKRNLPPLASESVGTVEDGVTAAFKRLNPHINI